MVSGDPNLLTTLAFVQALLYFFRRNFDARTDDKILFRADTTKSAPIFHITSPSQFCSLEIVTAWPIVKSTYHRVLTVSSAMASLFVVFGITVQFYGEELFIRALSPVAYKTLGYLLFDPFVCDIRAFKEDSEAMLNSKRKEILTVVAPRVSPHFCN